MRDGAASNPQSVIRMKPVTHCLFLLGNKKRERILGKVSRNTFSWVLHA